MNRLGERGRGGDLALVQGLDAALEAGPQLSALRVAEREGGADALARLSRPVGTGTVGQARTAGVTLFGVVGEALLRLPEGRHVIRQGRVGQLTPAAAEVHV